MQLLAGDIGGTHSRLMLASMLDGRLQIEDEKHYASEAFDDFLPLVEKFLQQHGKKTRPAAACFAVAGPVRRQCARITNLPWQLQADELASRLGIPSLMLINDFQAIGYGMAQLQATDFVELQAGRPEEEGRRALIGAGTGLGEALLIWQDDHYVPWPTEGGHVDFAPRDELEMELLRWLRTAHGHVSYEMVLSGPGLVRIYEFLHDSGRFPDSPAVWKGITAASISEQALAGSDELAEAALDCFVRIYGAQAGNFALNCLATGGVYIAGGIAPHILEKLRHDSFIEAFRDKGPLSHLMHDIPVSVILNEKAGLLGAAECAARLSKSVS